MKRDPNEHTELKITLSQAQCDALAEEAKAKGVRFFDHCRDKLLADTTERPSESTLPFTSPTLVLTNFLLAHAVELPTTRSVTGTAMKNFLNMIEPPNPNSGEIARPRIHSGLAP